MFLGMPCMGLPALRRFLFPQHRMRMPALLRSEEIVDVLLRVGLLAPVQHLHAGSAMRETRRMSQGRFVRSGIRRARSWKGAPVLRRTRALAANVAQWYLPSADLSLRLLDLKPSWRETKNASPVEETSFAIPALGEPQGRLPVQSQ